MIESLYLIIGYNNSKIEAKEERDGFKGGGLTAGIEFASRSKGEKNFGLWSVALKRSAQKFSPTTPSFFGVRNTMDNYNGSYWFLQLAIKFAHGFK